jgi:hypothetical protein
MIGKLQRNVPQGGSRKLMGSGQHCKGNGMGVAMERENRMKMEVDGLENKDYLIGEEKG